MGDASPTRPVAIVRADAILPDAPVFWQNVCNKRYSISEAPPAPNLRAAASGNRAKHSRPQPLALMRQTMTTPGSNGGASVPVPPVFSTLPPDAPVSTPAPPSPAAIHMVPEATRRLGESLPVAETHATLTAVIQLVYGRSPEWTAAPFVAAPQTAANAAAAITGVVDAAGHVVEHIDHTLDIELENFRTVVQP